MIKFLVVFDKLKSCTKHTATLTFVLLLSSIFSISCQKETDIFRLSSLDTPKIKGYFVRDFQGSIIRAIDNPNVKTKGIDDTGVDHELFLYPNPSNGNFFIGATTTVDSSYLKKIWITPAVWHDTDSEPNFSYDITNANLLKAGGSPIVSFESTQEFFAFSNQFQILAPGYYKVYVQIGSLLLHDNLVITQNQ